MKKTRPLVCDNTKQKMKKRKKKNVKSPKSKKNPKVRKGRMDPQKGRWSICFTKGHKKGIKVNENNHKRRNFEQQQGGVITSSPAAYNSRFSNFRSLLRLGWSFSEDRARSRWSALCGILPGPLAGRGLVARLIRLVNLGNLGDQRVIRIGVIQQ